VALLSGPYGPIECLVTGSGRPVTLFAHGFASSIVETRPFGSGVLGSRVFFSFRGHGATPPVDGAWTYPGLATELSAVRATYDATRGLGVSLGAGALLRAAVDDPNRFERLVLVLPPALDAPRRGKAVARVEAMARCAASHDVDGLTQLLLAEQPAEVRTGRAVRMWAQLQAERLSGGNLRDAITQIPALFPLEHRSLLSLVSCPVLVVGQEGDEAHPSQVVHDLAEALPAAEPVVFSAGGVLWTHRAALRSLVSNFLNQ
jgi:pimeloyl-ACP methyl ester carboxylesterase